MQEEMQARTDDIFRTESVRDNKIMIIFAASNPENHFGPKHLGHDALHKPMQTEGYGLRRGTRHKPNFHTHSLTKLL